MKNKLAISPLIPFITVLLILAFLGSKGIKGFFVSNILLLVLFLFAQVAIDPKQGSFYSVMIVGVWIMFFAGFVIKAKTGIDIYGSKLQGFWAMLAIIGIGLAITYVIRLLAGPGSAASVLGVPKTLAVSNVFISTLTPTLIAALGYIENRFFFGLINVIIALFSFVPVLSIFSGLFFGILPILVVSALFAVFHIAVFALPSMLFAFLAFLVFAFVAVSPLGPEGPNQAHYIHNGLETLPKTLAVVS